MTYPHEVVAQPSFQKAFQIGDGCVGHSMAQGSDGSFYVISETHINGIRKDVVLKIDSFGSIVWSKILGYDPVEDIFTSSTPTLIATYDNGFAVATEAYSELKKDQLGVLFKYDSAAILQWATTVNTSELKVASVTQALDHSFLVTCNAPKASTSELIKVTESGAIAWNRHGADPSTGRGIYAKETVQINNNSYVMAGTSVLIGGRLEVMAFSQSGEALWYRGLRTGLPLLIEDICSTEDRGMLICGTSLGGRSAFGDQLFVVKFDSLGHHLWNRQFSLLANTYGESISVLPSGKILVTGYFSQRQTVDNGEGIVSDSLLLLLLDTTGFPQVAKRVAIAHYASHGTSVIGCQNNSIGVCGFLRDLYRDTDMLLVMKLDSTLEGCAMQDLVGFSSSTGTPDSTDIISADLKLFPIQPYSTPSTATAITSIDFCPLSVTNKQMEKSRNKIILYPNPILKEAPVKIHCKASVSTFCRIEVRGTLGNLLIQKEGQIDSKGVVLLEEIPETAGSYYVTVFDTTGNCIGSSSIIIN